jgi:HK97 family phage major capsid protein
VNAMPGAWHEGLAATAVLADMSQVAVARDVSPTVTVLNELYAKTDEVGLRVVTRYDVGLLYPEGVIVLTEGGS